MPFCHRTSIRQKSISVVECYDLFNNKITDPNNLLDVTINDLPENQQPEKSPRPETAFNPLRRAFYSGKQPRWWRFPPLYVTFITAEKIKVRYRRSLDHCLSHNLYQPINIQHCKILHKSRPSVETGFCSFIQQILLKTLSIAGRKLHLIN